MWNLRAFTSRILALFNRRRVDADLDDEVRAYLELLAAAALVPARRSSRIDPMMALRSE